MKRFDLAARQLENLVHVLAPFEHVGPLRRIFGTHPLFEVRGKARGRFDPDDPTQTLDGVAEEFCGISRRVCAIERVMREITEARLSENPASTCIYPSDHLRRIKSIDVFVQL